MAGARAVRVTEQLRGFQACRHSCGVTPGVLTEQLVVTQRDDGTVLDCILPVSPEWGLHQSARRAGTLVFSSTSHLSANPLSVRPLS